MASSTTKAGPSTAASTNMLQPTNAAQASGLASLITATATPAFIALGSPHASSPLSVVSPFALQRQAEKKVASEIDTLVELGKAGGTTEVSLEQTEAYIKAKICILQADINDPKKRPSVRSDLCKLSRISSTYYSDLKEEIFNFLIRVIEEDPITPQSAHGVLEVVIDLNTDLALPQVQVLTIPLQKKLAKAFSATIELFLRHYNVHHFNGITEELKKKLIETQNSFNDLNTHEIEAIDFNIHMAVEASKRLVTDLSAFKECVARATNILKAIGMAYNTDVSGFFSAFGQAIDGLDDKFKEKWFDALFVLRGLVNKASDNKSKVIFIQTLLVTKKATDDWKVIYGALEILGEVASQLQAKETKLLEAILFGQVATGVDTAAAESLGLAKETAALSAAVVQSVAPRIPGVAEFWEFHGYVTKAFKAMESNRKADSAIQAKAKELCTILTNKLSSTYRGRKLLADRFDAAKKNSKEKTIVQALGSIIPSDPKARKEWLKSIDAGRSLPYSIGPQLEQFLHKLNHTAAANIAESNPLQQKQQDDKEKDSKQAASVSSIGTAAAKEEPTSDFHKAVIEGDFERVEKCISQNNELANTKDPKGRTPLIIAAGSGHLKVCEFLLKAGANPNAKGQDGFNALHFTALPGKVDAEQGRLDVCEALLKAGANPYATCEDGLNTLHIAAISGKVAMIQMLSKNKPLIDSQCDDGGTSLMLAVLSGSLKVCEALLKAGANQILKNKDGYNALHIAALYAKRTSFVRLFSKDKLLIDSKTYNGSTPLTIAAAKGHLETCKILLEANVDTLAMDNNGMNAMHYAVGHKKIEIARLLSANKKLIDAKDEKFGFTPLMLALRQNDREACELILKANADPFATDNTGKNAMHWAAFFGNTEIVRLLSVYKQLIDSHCNDGRTPLMIAAQEGHPEVCEVLLKAGANPNLTHKSGRNALQIAENAGKAEVVKLLSEHMKQSDANK